MDYKDKVLPIMRETRKILLPHWGKAKILYQKNASAVNVVTKLDIEIEKFISSRLTKLFPDIKFVGEESGGNRNAERYWIMDPVDGTQHLVRGTPFTTTMIALVEEGKVIFSVIYDFINDQMYWAKKGQGSFCEKTRLKVSNRTLNQEYICWETHLEKPKNQKIFGALYNKTIMFKTVSAGWEFAMVASGKFDARICFDPHGNDYDYAPGSLLVSEAGGVVTNLFSKEYNLKNTN